MIGVKSILVAALAATTLAIALVRDQLQLDRFTDLSAASAFAIGLFASISVALVGFGWRPEIASRAALAVRRGRPALLLGLTARERVRELPPILQRGLLIGVCAIIAFGTFDSHATARIASTPADLAEPSRAEYCLPQPEEAKEEPPPPIVEPADEAGCALVKRAVELGYKKDLGNCAPKVIKVETPRIKREREICDRRQLDEPFLHYTWRRLVDAASETSPIDSTQRWATELQLRTGYVGDFLRDVQHSITGTPHGSHHLWINLPDPHPRTWRDLLSGHVPCANRFADLALWPRWTEQISASLVVEHVLGQLLFATRFGTPASCSDYTIHWSAKPDACTRLAANAVAFLEDEDALEPMRHVLDRRNRQLALRTLAAELGHPATLPPPPPARTLVSAACFVVGEPAGAPPEKSTGRDVLLDGESITMRELHVPAVQATGSGPVDLYVALALLLGGTPYTGPAATAKDRFGVEPAPASFEETSFPLLRLEPLVDADPFVGAKRVLDAPEVLEVYPFEKHLFAFVDAFRRAYLPQRGRL